VPYFTRFFECFSFRDIVLFATGIGEKGTALLFLFLDFRFVSMSVLDSSFVLTNICFSVAMLIQHVSTVFTGIVTGFVLGE
jgi:hypothetical protein